MLCYCFFYIYIHITVRQNQSDTGNDENAFTPTCSQTSSFSIIILMCYTIFCNLGHFFFCFFFRVFQRRKYTTCDCLPCVRFSNSQYVRITKCTTWQTAQTSAVHRNMFHEAISQKKAGKKNTIRALINIVKTMGITKFRHGNTGYYIPRVVHHTNSSVFWLDVIYEP